MIWKAEVILHFSVFVCFFFSSLTHNSLLIELGKMKVNKIKKTL